MPSSKKSPKNRYSCGSVIQERAKCLLEKLLDYGDKALRFDQGFKEEGIQVNLLNSKQNERGLEFNINRTLLAIWIGVRTENEILPQQKSKNVSDQIKQVVLCLKEFEVISFYKASTSGMWKLILPHGDKNKLINKFPTLVNGKKAIALSPQQKSVESGAGSIEANSFLEYFSKSIDQLKSKELDVRIGAISTLGTLAKNSPPAENWTIMEYLAAFVRTNAPRNKDEEDQERWLLKKLPEDIQAALTIIVQRKLNKNEGVINLSNTDLRGAKLSKSNLYRVNLHRANLAGVSLFKANLHGANLRGANLQNARLREADLQWAKLWGANLQGASLRKANLERAELEHTKLHGANFSEVKQGASLRKANLERAELEHTKLHGANFSEVNLHKTYLRGVDLTGVKNLNLKQIASADGDSMTRLPENLNPPLRWMQAKPLTAKDLLIKAAIELRNR